ncbi:MAG TPA: FxDxF family PEP-CTERM protein [Telluria sp.]|nr:FxDxF family PEP-CTERM protein [Telluria sp.]
MKNSKSLMAAMVFATASLGSTAFAADISTAPQALTFVDTSAFFGDAFAMNNASNTFADHFTFAVTGTAPTNLDAIVSSISRSADTGLDITGLSLFNAGGTLVSSGASLQSGTIDVWTLKSDSLAAGNYYVQVSGTMAGTTSGAFGGAIMLAPVPEPETYGMMLAGLGLVGFLARRRKVK